MSALKLLVVVLFLGVMSSGRPAAQRPAAAPAVTARAVSAANAFLATLDDAKRAKARLPLTNATRVVWSNLPTGITLQSGATERNGVKLGDLTPVQQKAALDLLATVLSRDGYTKVLNIVTADEVLETRTAPKRPAGNRVRFGRAEYYTSILGTPSETDMWMVQFGGHHLAINVTVAGRQPVLTPTHTGAQPATYTLDGQTVRPLGDENDRAFALMNALSPDLQKQALLGYQVRNLVTGPGEDGKTIQPEGVRVSAFSADERAMLLDLVREWVDILEGGAAAAKMADVKANLNDTWFAWAGPTTNGSGAYFRIQGPTVMIEYAPQGQAATNTDHIHTIYRDPTNDYAAKALRPGSGQAARQ